MKKFIVNYCFDGQGTCIIEAKSKAEAREKFLSGNYEIKTEDEWGDNYFISTIEERIKK